MKQKWKSIYISNLNYKLLFFNFKTFSNIKILNVDRNETILPSFLGKQVKVHNGHDHKTFIVRDDMLYHKFGEFYQTRKKAVYKAKSKKK